MEKHKKKKVLLCVIAVIVCAVLIGFGWNFYTFYALETFGYTEMEEVAKTMSNLANGQTSKVSLIADDELYAVFVSDSENEQQAPAAFILRELPFGVIQKTGRYKVMQKRQTARCRLTLFYTCREMRMNNSYYISGQMRWQ